MNDQRTDEQLNAIIGEWHTGRRYTLLKRRMYYRPNAAGYTFDINEAWHLTLEEARKREYNPRGCDEPVEVVPVPWKNYCRDLNACHEAAMSATQEVRWRVNSELEELLGFDADIDSLINATARQRAEALVRVIEKEGK